MLVITKPKTKIHATSFWDKKDRLKNKPSLSLRTIEVIQYVMCEEEITLGLAVEKLMVTSNLYDEVIEKLSHDYDDIKK